MPVIEWGDWQAAQSAVNSANKAVSGLSAAEAETALNFTKVTLNDGTVRYVMNSASTPTSTPQINFDTGAVDASWEYVNSGGQVSQTGAAVSGANSTQSTNMAMTQTATGATGVGALLSVNLPTAAAAIAPIAGVALGAGLYALNPDLWDKISRALLPFCYEDTQLLPVVVDENGNTYFPKEAIDAVSNELKDIATTGVGTPNPADEPLYSSGINPYPVQVAKGVTSISYVGVWHYADGRISRIQYSIQTPVPVNCFLVFNTGNSSFDMVLCSDNSFKYEYTTKALPNGSPVTRTAYASDKYKYNDRTVYYDLQGAGSSNPAVERLPPENMSPSLTPSIVNNSIINMFSQNGPIAWSSWYGDMVVEYPQGTGAWTGVQYPINPEGIGVITRITPDGVVATNPYYPVTMPVGDPGVSPNPAEVPQPGVNPEVAPAVNPWLTPNPNPNTYPEGQPESDPAKVPDPVPDTDPNLDPNANPSQAPQPQPESSPDPVPSTKPGDGGNTPPPVIPIIPTLPSAATGLLHVYNPTQSQIDAFGSWLWTTFSGDLIDTISKLFNDPMDAVIGLHELYATPAVAGSSTIRAGFLDSGVSSNLVGSRYTTINCGSIVVQEYYQNYLDYSPYTKCYIYLPFVGIVPVLADDIIGNAVNVTYHVDSYTGCCIAVVTVARTGYSSTVYQFEGNCAVEIPITSGYQSTLMGALIGAGATALTGNPHAGIAAANMGRASLGKNDVSHSGSFGSSYGAMGAKVPYIIVKRPTQKSVVNYNQDYGFPAHKRVTIGACSGYLRAREVHVISPTATNEEKAKIEELLKSGVFVE